MMRDMITERNQIRISLGTWACMILLPVLFLIYPLEALSAPSSMMGRYIVILSDEVDSARVEGVATELVQRHQAVLEHVYTKAIKGFSASIPSHRLSLLLSDPQVNNVVEDWQVEAFCHTGTQTTPTGVDRVDADLSLTAGINGIDNTLDVDIAILDTGIYTHQDLNIFASVNCTKAGGCKKVSPADKNGHGTHVAGIVAARDNSKAVVGVAPGSRLWMVKVLNDNGSGFVSWIIAGIDYVTTNASAIEVANMSLGGSGIDTGNCGMVGATVNDPFHKAICNSIGSGVTYTVAAGNESQDASTVTPAAYPEVITVSALADSNGQRGGGGPATSYGADDTFATFSNFGAVVDLIAPGVDINSTWPGDRKAPQGYCAVLNGTSMAAPHAAGAAALYIRSEMNKRHSRPSPAIVRDALRSAGQCPDGSVFGTTGSCATGWSGDPDGITEPLINVSGF